jgi:hypothetical protein
MRTYSQKQNQPRMPGTSSLARSNMPTSGPAHGEHPILHLHRAIGNQAAQRLLQTNLEELNPGLTGSASSHWGHDITQIPGNPPPARAIQTKLGINKLGDEQEPEHVAAEEIRPITNFPHAARGHRFDFTRIPVTAPKIQRKPAITPSGDSIGAPQFIPEREAAAPAERVPYASQAGRPLPFLDIIQRSFGRHDLSHIQAHTDSGGAARAWAIGAEAFVQGPAVTFLRTPSLHTAAHEAAHVIQQRAGVDVPGGVGREGDEYERHADEVADRVARGQSSEALLDAPPDAGGSGLDTERGSGAAQDAASRPPVVQMRRIPPNVRALLTAVGGGKGANFFANEEGALRLIDRAMEELAPTDRAKVQTARLGGLTEAQFNALPRLERRSRWAEAIIAQFPDLELGDPKLIDTGARPATSDAANITKLVNNANNKIFNSIASGARDTWLTQVFGAGSVAAAKAKYANAKTSMNALQGTNSIVTDRSGYSEEVSLGGLTDPPGTPNQVIRLEKSAIDDPDKNDSVATLVHESMHAGNADIGDKYVGFDTDSDANKLTFASCFEVVAWRILDPTNSLAFAIDPLATPPTFKTFIPAGTTVGGVTAPALTKAEEGSKAAGDLFREAWTTGLNLHPFYVHLFKKPTDWTVPQADFGGNHFNNSLPFWSKVQKLTIHDKTTIDPASPDEAKHPVSQIDIALSEGLTRRLAHGMDVLDPLQKQPDILAFENANSSAAERSGPFPGGAHTNADAERDFLLKLTVRHPTVKPMTGTEARDLRVVRQMGTLIWGTVLDPRNPSAFPD